MRPEPTQATLDLKLTPPAQSHADCAILPPGFEPLLAGGTPCDLPDDCHTAHRTTTPEGKRYIWDGFQCAYPEDCVYEGDSECCVSFYAIDDDGMPL